MGRVLLLRSKLRGVKKTLLLSAIFSASTQLFGTVAVSGNDYCTKLANTIANAISLNSPVVNDIETGVQTCATNPFSGVSKPLIVNFAPGLMLNAGSTALTVPSNVTLKCPVIYSCVFTGSRSGVFIDTSGGSNIAIEGLAVTTTNDRAIAIKFGNAQQHVRVRDTIVQGTNTTTNTGICAFIDAQTPGSFSGGYNFDHFYCLGYKYGIEVWSHSGANTVTQIAGTNVWIAGRFAGHIVGSVGVWCREDSGTNGGCAGSKFIASLVEQNTTGLVCDAGAFGIDYDGDAEGNDTQHIEGAGCNPQYHFSISGEYFKQSWNSTANIYDKEQDYGGVLTRESRGDQNFVLYDDSLVPEHIRFYRGNSLISGGSPTEKFGMTFGRSSDPACEHNEWHFLSHKFTSCAGSPPGSGTWAVGDIAFNTSASAGAPMGWINTSAGTPGTWTVLANAGTTTTTVVSGTSTLGSSSIAAATCHSVVTTPATGVAATDAITWSYASEPSGSTDGKLILNAYPTSGNVNFMLCNPTASALVPTGLVVNWRVLR